MIQQIPLPFKIYPSYASHDFMPVHEQESVLTHLPPSPLHGRGIYVYGSEKSGKTHLAHLFRERGLKMITSIEQALNAKDDVVIDGIKSEIDLFHIINHIFGIGKKAVLFLPFFPDNIALPDLRSRVKLLELTQISPPSQEFMKILFFKHFYDLQIHVSEDAIDFLVLRITRDYKSIHDTAQILNQRSMIEKRPITIPFIKEIFTI